MTVPLTDKKQKSISSHPSWPMTPGPTQTWGRRWRGGCAERCPWAAAGRALRSGCGRPTAAAGSWRHGTEAAGWELAGAATTQCCPLLETNADGRERSEAFRTHMLRSHHVGRHLSKPNRSVFFSVPSILTSHECNYRKLWKYLFLFTFHTVRIRMNIKRMNKGTQITTFFVFAFYSFCY